MTTTTTTTTTIDRLRQMRDGLLAKLSEDPRSKLEAVEVQLTAAEQAAAQQAAERAEVARQARILELRKAEETAFEAIVRGALGFMALCAALDEVHARLAAERELASLTDFGLSRTLNHALAAWPMIPAGRRALGIPEQPSDVERMVNEAKAGVDQAKQWLANARAWPSYNERVDLVKEREQDLSRAEDVLKWAENNLRESRKH